MFALATDAAPGRPNQDFALATTDIAVVVDGEAPGDDGDCSHGAAWFARQLGTHVLLALADEPQLPLTEALGRAVRAVGRLHIYTCDLSSERTPSATIGILRLTEDRVDVLALGDCAVVVDTDAGPQVTRDAAEDDARRVGGDPQVAQLAVTNSYPKAWVRRVAALSRGAAWPAGGTGPAAYGWSDYLDLLDKIGAGSLIATSRSWWEAGHRPPGLPVEAAGPDDATVVHATL